MTNDFLSELLTRYPKTRPPLSREIEKIYSEHYQDNREGNTVASSVAQKMEGWLHRMVASDLAGSDSVKHTLELGAGTLNQLKYEPAQGVYDVVEPFKKLYEGKRELKRVRTIFTDISEVPLALRYDRITSVATLEHIVNLPYVVAISALHLNDNGVFRASIPSEGTFLWRLGWQLTTGLEFRIKYGLDYGDLMRHEHVNTAKDIADVLGYFFAKIETKVFGVAKAISLYQFYGCANPCLERCGEYLRMAPAKSG